MDSSLPNASNHCSFLSGNRTWEPSCHYKFSSCNGNKDPSRAAGIDGNCMWLEGTIYSDASAAWVLIAAIIVFFMKAGFMLLESAFAKEPSDRRNVIIIKHIDAFASALGFFVLGCDFITDYSSTYPISRSFFNVQQPLLWFFKFTFASNAATLLGGCLIDFEYKLRLPAAFISAFMISGVVHPAIARLIWSYDPNTLSPFRYCQFPWGINGTVPDVNCESPLAEYFAVDFAGGGAVHLLGGTAGLVVCLFAKFEKWRQDRKTAKQEETDSTSSSEDEEEDTHQGFLEWMYSVDNDSNIEHAALGVLILWFAWFAFNCGSTENISGGEKGYWHSVPSRIAVNMIMCCASGGTVAVIIASWAQLRIRSGSLNANEIANGVLSCLVAITASCPFVTYWQACIIGILAIICYHLGTYLEYKFGIPDTARVVPVHAISGLLGVLMASLAATPINKCFLHAAYEGTVICQLRLPDISFGQLLAAQCLVALAMIGAGLSMGLVYFLLFIVQMKWLEPIIKLLTCRKGKIGYSGNLLFTCDREQERIKNEPMMDERMYTNISQISQRRRSNNNIQTSLSTPAHQTSMLSGASRTSGVHSRNYASRTASRSNYGATGPHSSHSSSRQEQQNIDIISVATSVNSTNTGGSTVSFPMH